MFAFDLESSLIRSRLGSLASIIADEFAAFVLVVAVRSVRGRVSRVLRWLKTADEAGRLAVLSSAFLLDIKQELVLLVLKRQVVAFRRAQNVLDGPYILENYEGVVQQTAATLLLCVRVDANLS